jgi:DNA-binding GntR family transcriptional regulator
MAEPNKTTRAYEAIEGMITFQELVPGSLISEAMLMERTGLGRTPVREALQRLARERMVEIHPNRGVFVPPASIEAQLKLLELRRSLEALAVRLATHRALAEQKRQMQEVIEHFQRGAGRACLRRDTEAGPRPDRGGRTQRIPVGGHGSAAGVVAAVLVRAPPRSGE